jgi:predicted unusual protein kinase regulating ubiquinone biosynthesis (AarF/ABC1/UbiB family)
VFAATDLVEELGALKGLLMKLGQMASYVPAAPSAEARQTLGRLQAHGTPFAFDEIARVLEDDLGADCGSLFDSVERRPLAAASIGQVHRARWRGRDVAVKVQYPGIEKVLAQDLAAVRLFARVGTFGLPIDGGALVEELRDRVVEECDYTREARNQTLFRSVLRKVQGARVPEVILERSSRRVLTSDLVLATDFHAFRAGAPRAARNRAGEILFRGCFDALFHHCVFNADPHPGNYLFDPDGAVTFLDFGCVRRFAPGTMDAWKRLARSVLDGDRAGFEEEFAALGFVANRRRLDWEHQWKAFRHLYQPFLTPKTFEFTPAFIRETHDLLVFRNPNVLRTAMPREWLMVNRLQWGLNSVLAELHAEARWSEAFREAVESATEPVEDAPLSHGAGDGVARGASGRGRP